MTAETCQIKSTATCRWFPRSLHNVVTENHDDDIHIPSRVATHQTREITNTISYKESPLARKVRPKLQSLGISWSPSTPRTATKPTDDGQSNHSDRWIGLISHIGPQIHPHAPQAKKGNRNSPAEEPTTRTYAWPNLRANNGDSQKFRARVVHQ